MIGRFINRGTALKQDSEEVFDHEFPSRATGKATTIAIFDLQANTGWVGLGLSRDSPYFAVDCIEAWRIGESRQRFRQKSRGFPWSVGISERPSHGELILFLILSVIGQARTMSGDGLASRRRGYSRNACRSLESPNSDRPGCSRTYASPCSGGTPRVRPFAFRVTEAGLTDHRAVRSGTRLGGR